MLSNLIKLVNIDKLFDLHVTSAMWRTQLPDSEVGRLNVPLLKYGQ